MSDTLPDIGNNLHLPVLANGSLDQILKAVQREVSGILAGNNIVKHGRSLTTALSTDLNSLGIVLDKTRLDGESDSTFRARIQTAADDFESQTDTAIINIIKTVTAGWSATIEDADDIDFITDYGFPYTGGAFRVQIPYNLTDEALDIQAQVNKIKGAGVAFILEYIEDMFFTSFTDVVTASDLLLTLMYGTFTDSLDTPTDEFYITALMTAHDTLWYWTMTDAFWFDLLSQLDETFSAGITDSIAGSHIEGFLTDVLRPREWDIAQWDKDTWDKSIGYDELSFIAIKEFIEAFTAGITESLFKDGIIYRTESITSLTDAIGGHIEGFFTDIYHSRGWDIGQWDKDTWESGVGMDELFFLRLYALVESYADTNWDDAVLFIIDMFLTESMSAGSLTYDLYKDMIGYLTETLSSLQVDLWGHLEGYLTETLSNAKVAKIGTATVNEGWGLGGGLYRIVDQQEWDLGDWDNAAWDGSDSIAYLTEVF